MKCLAENIESINREILMQSTISEVVNRGACIGCGACASKDISNEKLIMKMSDIGMFVPTLVSESLSAMENERAIKVCPFNPSPSIEVRNEDVIASHFIDDNSQHNEYLGKYNGLFAGYSIQARDKASSGGVATWLLTTLLDKKIVDAVVCVISDDGAGFKYSIARKGEDITRSSKTKYYPVTLNEVFDIMLNEPGKYAVTGVPCFIKAVRLRQLENKVFNELVVFTIGIFCGGYKSKGFTDYLISKASGNIEMATNINYRKKSLSGQASDYSFSFNDRGSREEYSLRMRAVGDMWGTGLFKPLACDYCDDLSSELADISLGDAWIPPYNNNPKGTNIVITRSKLARELVQLGLESDELKFDVITEKQACTSQQGNITHRRIGLGHRLALGGDSFFSNERVEIKKSKNITFHLVQKQRMIVRELSEVNWLKYKDSEKFDKSMSYSLKKLRLLTKINHLTRRGYVISVIHKLVKKIKRT